MLCLIRRTQKSNVCYKRQTKKHCFLTCFAKVTKFGNIVSKPNAVVNIDQRRNHKQTKKSVQEHFCYLESKFYVGKNVCWGAGTFAKRYVRSLKQYWLRSIWVNLVQR